MSAVELVRPTKDEAIAAVIEAAFEVTDPSSDDFGRKLVHCYTRGIGADWDLDTVIATVKNARDIAWVDHLMDHDLVVLSDEGKTRCFNVQRPEAAQAEKGGTR